MSSKNLSIGFGGSRDRKLHKAGHSRRISRVVSSTTCKLRAGGDKEERNDKVIAYTTSTTGAWQKLGGWFSNSPEHKFTMLGESGG